MAQRTNIRSTENRLILGYVQKHRQGHDEMEADRSKPPWYAVD